MKSVLMFSGGLDSLIGYFYLMKMNGQEPVAVYSALGHRYMFKEIQSIYHIKNQMDYHMQDYAKFYLIPDMSLHLGKWEESNANIPMRNMFLAMVGAYYGDRVYVVCQKGEQELADRSPHFFQEATGMLQLLLQKDVRVLPLFENMTKTQMVKWYLENEYPVELLKSSVSCYTGSSPSKQCGKCSSCFRRWVAMSLNGIEEEYDSNPWEWDGVPGYLERIEQNHYIKERSDDILEALRRKGVI